MVAHSCYWFDRTPIMHRLTVGLPRRADVVIIGGGIPGLSLLFELTSNSDKEVVLLEETLPGYSFGRNSGHVVVGDLETFNYNKTVGKNYLIDYLNLTKLNNDIFLNLLQEYDIHCDYNAAGSFRLVTSEKDFKYLTATQKYLESTQHYNSQCAIFNKTEISHLLDSPAFEGGLFFPGDATIDPYQLTIELWNCLGDNIITHARVEDVIDHGDRFSVKIKDRGIITSSQVVYCTSSNLTNKHQLICTEPLPQSIMGAFPYFSMMTSDFYLRTLKNRIIVGGAIQDECDGHISRSLFDKVSRFLFQSFPMVRANISHTWSYLSASTDDGLPIVGSNDGRTFVNVGYGGMGINLSFLAGKILAEQIVTGSSDLPGTDLFDPGRGACLI